MIPRITITNDLDPANANATHNLWGIRIRPASVLPYQTAVLAQERYEWTYLRKFGLACGVVVCAVAAYLAISQDVNPLLAGAIALMLSFGFHVGLQDPLMKITGLSRRMELTSHMIEVLWAVRDGADREGYLAAEVRSLMKYPKFKGWTAEELRAAMLAKESAARKWLRGQS
jgi:hypothetical protein